MLAGAGLGKPALLCVFISETGKELEKENQRLGFNIFIKSGHFFISLSFKTRFCMFSLEYSEDLVLSISFGFLISFPLFSPRCSQVFPTFGQ